MENKNNESINIPEVLDNLEISNTIVTADALNCQKTIAAKIIEKKQIIF